MILAESLVQPATPPQKKKTSPGTLQLPASKSSTSKGLTPHQKESRPAICVFQFKDLQKKNNKHVLFCTTSWTCFFHFSFILPTPGRTFRSLRWDLLFTGMFRLSSLGRRVRIEIGPRFRSWFHLGGSCCFSCWIWVNYPYPTLYTYTRSYDSYYICRY